MKMLEISASLVGIVPSTGTRCSMVVVNDAGKIRTMTDSGTGGSVGHVDLYMFSLCRSNCRECLRRVLHAEPSALSCRRGQVVGLG